MPRVPVAHIVARSHALDFAGLVNVAAFLADRVELVEEQNARHGARIIEKAREPGVRLAEIGADECIVADREKLDGQGFSDRFGDRGLAVARGTREQDAVTRLHPVGAQEIGTVLLFDELLNLARDRQRQDQVVDPLTRLAFKNGVPAGMAAGCHAGRRSDRHGIQRPLEPVGQDIVVLLAFIGNNGIDR